MSFLVLREIVEICEVGVSAHPSGVNTFMQSPLHDQVQVVNKRDWNSIGFRATEAQKAKLEKLSDETGRSQQDILHSALLNLISDIELDDPRMELRDVREEKRRIRDNLDSIQQEMREMREQVEDLQNRERDLERRVEEHDIIGVDSYDDAVAALAAKAGGGTYLTPYSEEVQRVAAEWQRGEMDVIRQAWEYHPRVRDDWVEGQTALDAPRSDWSRRLGDDLDDAVSLAVEWINERRDDESSGSFGGVGAPAQGYLSHVANEHELEVAELVERVADELDANPRELIRAPEYVFNQ